MTETSFWWVRHAPVVDNGGLVYGGVEIDADTSDRKAFEGLARLLPRDAVFVASALRRTSQTLQAVRDAGRDDIPADVPRDPRLNEQSLGDWHGEKITRLFPNGLPWPGFWMLDADDRAPGGESFRDVCQRVDAAVLDLLEEHRGRHVVAAAHGGVIRAALRQALDIDPARALAFTVANCSVTRIDRIERPGAAAWRISCANLTSG